jgi:hypothetical protein
MMASITQKSVMTGHLVAAKSRGLSPTVVS